MRILLLLLAIPLMATPLRQKVYSRDGQDIYRIQYSDTQFYEGTLQKTKYHGRGILKSESGDRYRGEWKKGKKHGKGLWVGRNFDRYQGQWENDKKHGKGTYHFDCGDHFKGQWKNGLPHGKGVYKWKSGTRLQCTWHKGEPNGPATYQTKAGKEQRISTAKRLIKADQKNFFSYYDKHLGAATKKPTHYLLPRAIVDPREESFRQQAHGKDFDRFKKKALKQLRIRQQALRAIQETTRQQTSDEVIKAHGIESARLGLILDNSASMTQFLPPLRRKIKKAFNKPTFLEVKGCKIIPTRRVKARQKTQYSHTLDAIYDLIHLHRVDSIYWFSDLNDIQKDDALTQLSFLLQANAIKLYVSSIDKKPSPQLHEIIRESGGKFLRN